MIFSNCVYPTSKSYTETQFQLKDLFIHGRADFTHKDVQRQLPIFFMLVEALSHKKMSKTMQSGIEFQVC